MKKLFVLSLLLLSSVLLLGCTSVVESPETTALSKAQLQRYNYEDAKAQYEQDTRVPLGGLSGNVYNLTHHASEDCTAAFEENKQSGYCAWALHLMANESNADGLAPFSRSKEFVVVLGAQPRFRPLELRVNNDGAFCVKIFSDFASVNNFEEAFKCKTTSEWKYNPLYNIVVFADVERGANASISGVVVPFELVPHDDKAKHEFFSTLEFEDKHGSLIAPQKAFRFRLGLNSMTEPAERCFDSPLNTTRGTVEAVVRVCVKSDSELYKQIDWDKVVNYTVSVT